MSSTVYAEYVGLTQETITLIDGLRASPSETKDEILLRVLRPLPPNSKAKAPLRAEAPKSSLDLGQGVVLLEGERPLLFLSEAAKEAYVQRGAPPDAIAEIKAGGFYLNGARVAPSKGNPLQPAMHQVQRAKGHRNAAGDIVSLSAWRQWNVQRDGKLIRLLDLKDPAQAHKRRSTSPSLVTDISAEELGL